MQHPSLELTLNSHEKLIAEEILLFDARVVAQIIEWTAKATAKLQGVHTGIGFWGSPSWAIGGALVLGALEGAASQRSVRKGTEILDQLADVRMRLRRSGRMFSVAEVSNIELPLPTVWAAFGKVDRPVEPSSPGHRELAATDNIWAHETDVPVVDSNVPYSHSGEEFVAYKIDGTVRYVRWSSVSSYRLVSGSKAI